MDSTCACTCSGVACNSFFLTISAINKPKRTRRVARSVKISAGKTILSSTGMPRARKSSRALACKCTMSSFTIVVGTSNCADLTNASMTLFFVMPLARLAISRSKFNLMSACIFSTSPSFTPKDLANSAFSSGNCGAATALTVTVNCAVLPAKSLLWYSAGNGKSKVRVSVAFKPIIAVSNSGNIRP